MLWCVLRRNRIDPPLRRRWRTRAGGRALEQDCPAGEREPEQAALDPVSACPPRDRRRDPQAQAVEAVEQLAEESFAGGASQARKDSPRTIFPPEEMGQAPGGQDRDRQARDRLRDVPLWKTTLRALTNSSSGRVREAGAIASGGAARAPREALSTVPTSAHRGSDGRAASHGGRSVPHSGR